MKAALSIRTSEGIVFSHALAGPVTRAMAWFIDLLCILMICAAVGTLFRYLGYLSADLAQAVTLLSYFVVGIGYGIVTEWYWRGQTVGKRLLRLRVIDQQGLRLQFSQIVIRNLLRLADALPFFYLLGGIVCLVSSRSQRLGDIGAGTLVIRAPQIAEPDLDQIAPDKFNSLGQFPHLAARLRQRLSPQEAAVFLQAVLRRDQFDPAERLRLFADLAQKLKTEVRFPEEAVETLTPEQYVRNAVAILYRPSVTG